jgi:hypothetical protein
MKNLTISFVALFFVVSVCRGQTKDIKNYANNMDKKEKRIEQRTEHKEMRKLAVYNVSDYSLKSFNTDFGANSTVSWTKSDYFDEASFIRNGQETKAYYDFEGNLVGTTTNKTFTDIPLRGQKTITKSYSGFSVESVLLYDFNKLSDAQMILFNEQFVDSKNYFVQMTNGKERIVLQVTPVGQVFLFKQIK